MHSFSMRENYYNYDKEFSNYYKKDNIICLPIAVDKTSKPKKFVLQNTETLKYWTYGKQTDNIQEIHNEETRNNFCPPQGYKWVEVSND